MCECHKTCQTLPRAPESSGNTDVEQPMNEQDLSTDENITEQISEQKNEKPVKETSIKVQQEEQKEEIK